MCGKKAIFGSFTEPFSCEAVIGLGCGYKV